MRALVQRVLAASVSIDGKTCGQIGKGLLILLGICEGDSEREADYLADKCMNMRIFTDENDKMNLSLSDVGGELLIVSQFTLYGDCRKGRRPNFIRAARPQIAHPLYERFITHCRNAAMITQTGKFGADMQVSLINDGPVTLLLDTDEMLCAEGKI